MHTDREISVSIVSDFWQRGNVYNRFRILSIRDPFFVGIFLGVDGSNGLQITSFYPFYSHTT